VEEKSSSRSAQQAGKNLNSLQDLCEGPSRPWPLIAIVHAEKHQLPLRGNRCPPANWRLRQMPGHTKLEMPITSAVERHLRSEKWYMVLIDLRGNLLNGKNTGDFTE